jgi:hypothetical protein
MTSNDYVTKLNKTLQWIMSNSTHAFVIYVQINHFCNYKCDYPPWHLVKMTCSCMNNYKVICNLHMQLILVINVNLDENEKYTYIIHFLISPQNRWKCIFFKTWKVNA